MQTGFFLFNQYAIIRIAMAKNLRWEKLDNTANIFPVIAGESMTNTYRIMCVLKEDIDPELLQEAVNIITPKFPGFNQRLRIGVFWYYFEENGKPAPRVKEEHRYPCRFIHTTKNNSYMFRVTYFKNRINLEVFHALTDGMGGIGFIRELTYQYLRLAYPELRAKMGDNLSEETSLDREDSFKRNFKKSSGLNYKSGKAFLIKGEKLPYDAIGLIHGFMPIKELKAAAKSYGCSINDYLIATFVYSTYRSYAGKIERSKKPIRVAVPVNLRPFFESITTKNFFAIISAEFYPRKDDYTFGEIAETVRDSLKSQINKENLEKVFSYNLGFEQAFVARAVPLVFKNIGMKVVYHVNALANTSTITNTGTITVLPEYEPYIETFYSILTLSLGQYIKASIMSYKDTLCLTYSSLLKDTTIQKGVFQQIADDNVPVRIETNGVFYE